jgi:tetratricopeptide (TPR) repeat protein
LDGDGSFLGFLEVADRYSSTAAGNAACFYAGIAYLHLGQYEDAVTYLKKHSGGGLFGKALSLGNIGDAYSELGELDNALQYYKKAASASDNTMTTPRFFAKAAMILEQQGEYGEAVKLYEKIQHEYFNSTEANDAEKRIARLKVLMDNK